jgi:hypothetical protein
VASSPLRERRAKSDIVPIPREVAEEIIRRTASDAVARQNGSPGSPEPPGTSEHFPIKLGLSQPSWPGLSRPSTPCFAARKTWMPGTSLDKPGHDGGVFGSTEPESAPGSAMAGSMDVLCLDSAIGLVADCGGYPTVPYLFKTMHASARCGAMMTA